MPFAELYGFDRPVSRYCCNTGVLYYIILYGTALYCAMPVQTRVMWYCSTATSPNPRPKLPFPSLGACIMPATAIQHSSLRGPLGYFRHVSISITTPIASALKNYYTYICSFLGALTDFFFILLDPDGRFSSETAVRRFQN